MKTTYHDLPDNFDQLVEDGVLDCDLQDIVVYELRDGTFVFTYSAGVQGHGTYGDENGDPYPGLDDALAAARCENPALGVQEYCMSDEEYES